MEVLAPAKKSAVRSTKPSHLGLVALIVCLFWVDFGHGILRGQADTLFHPIYRVRQSLAIALSRMQDPPLGGYLAYKSVVDSFSRNGFAIFHRDPGPKFDIARTTALLSDGAQVDAVFSDALAESVDTSLPHQVIHANELGYADFISLSFVLFGVEVSSLYYLYFLILGISVSIYMMEFRRDPFLLYLLAIYLAGIFYAQSYAITIGIHGQALQNSRFFGALALLPAAHIAWLVLLGRPLTPWTLIGCLIQAALFAFIFSSRTPVLWQLGFVLCFAGVLSTLALFRREGRRHMLRSLGRRLIPAGIMACAAASAFGLTKYLAAEQYRTEPGSHVIWHSVLVGILSRNTVLQEKYITMRDPKTLGGDQLGHWAVMSDLNYRNDETSVIAYSRGGLIYIKPRISWNEYERLARGVVFRILREDPVEFLRDLRGKLETQKQSFMKMLPIDNLANSVVLGVVVVLISSFAGAFYVGGREVVLGMLAGGAILAFSLVPVLITPSKTSVEVLLCFMFAFVTIVAVVAVWAARALKPFALSLVEAFGQYRPNLK